MQNKIWKDCYGYEGLYAINNYGEVKSYDKLVWNRFRYILRPGRIMRTQIDRYGYVRVPLCKNGKKTNEQVHRLVMMTFVGNPNNLPQVNHRDLNKKNNYVGTLENNFADGNLEWCSNAQNMKHAFENKNFDYQTTPVVKIDIETNTVIKCYDSVQAASRDVHDNPTNILRSCHFDNDTAKGFRWRINKCGNYKIGDYINLPELYHPSTKKRKVMMIKDNMVLKIYDSIMDAARDNSCEDSAISMCCKGKIKSCHGFEWRYYDGGLNR